MPDVSEHLASAERYIFRSLNAVARPLIQRGLGSPCLTPVGLVVLEHRGRKTGATYSTPLWAFRAGQLLLVTTFRGDRSQWMRNLEDTPDAHVWLGGKRRGFRASTAASESGGATLPSTPADRVLASLRESWKALGLSVAVLRPV